MTQDSFADQSKEKFRTEADAEMDRAVDEAFAGVSLDALMAADPVQGSRAYLSGPMTGTVHSINPAGDILIELDSKNQGLAPLDQFETEPAIGAKVDVVVERFDEREGVYRLNKKGAAVSSVEWDTLYTGQILEGNVEAMNKGGLELKIGSMKAFMPAGQVDIAFHKDLSTFIGQRVKVVVQKADRKARSLIVSRRAIIEQERGEQRAKLFEELAEGQTRRATVRSVMEYGAFVDLGGADGLIHVSELTHRRGTKVEDVVRVGDLVDVKIIKFDKETGKISLSLKQLMADPWAGIESKYPVGAQVTGRVTRIEKFGAFIEIEEGMEGLLPVSEISWQRVNHVNDVLKPDDIIKLSVISLDAGAHKISLSLRQAGPDPWKTAAERFAVHQVVPGTVTRIVDFGAFVELEPGLEGLIHISELSDQRIRSAGDAVKPQQAVEVRVLEIDATKRRISLSLKQARTPKADIATTPATPAKLRPQRKGELRGGLESGWFK